MANSTMTSRERVIKSIKHEQPDRIPIDLGATPSSGISAIAYSNLKKYLRFKKGQTQIYDVVQQLAQPEMDIINHFNVDILDVGRAFNIKQEDWYNINLHKMNFQYPKWFHPIKNQDGSYDAIDSDGVRIATMPSGGYFYDQTYFPYKDGYPKNYDNLPKAMEKVLWSALVHSPWDNAGTHNFWETLRERTIKLREETDKALIIACGCNLFEWGTFLRGMENFLMDLIRRPYEVEKLLDHLMESHLVTLENVCESIGDIVDIVRFGDDLGTNHGPFMSPKTYQRFFKPRHTKLCKFTKDHSKMHTFLHSCGSINKLMPDLIECGYDIINPVQINSADMDPVDLKKKYGDKITFWGGGADTRNVLNKASPSEVRKHVTKLLEIFSPGGGFIFNTIHNILPDVPPENIIAMFEAVEKFNE